MKLSFLIAFIAILTFATCALSADVPPVNSTWVEGHWATVEGQQVWINGYWKAPSEPQVQQTQVVYVPQPTVIYVQQPVQQVVVYRTYSTFAPPIYNYGFYGHSCYNGYHTNGVSIHGSFIFGR